MIDAPSALVIDDDKNSGIVLVKLLEREDLSVSVVRHPAKIEEALTQLPDLKIIFVDLELPGLDGYEVFQLLREKLGNAVPIVAYSVHTSEMLTAINRGFDAFIGKPLVQRDFSTNLHRILSGERILGIL